MVKLCLSDIEFVALTHARAPYSSPRLMVVHFESVGLEKMSMTLEILVEMMSPTCFEEFVVEIEYGFYTLLYL